MGATIILIGIQLRVGHRGTDQERLVECILAWREQRMLEKAIKKEELEVMPRQRADMRRRLHRRKK